MWNANEEIKKLKMVVAKDREDLVRLTTENLDLKRASDKDEEELVRLAEENIDLETVQAQDRAKIVQMAKENEELKSACACLTKENSDLKHSSGIDEEELSRLTLEIMNLESSRAQEKDKMRHMTEENENVWGPGSGGQGCCSCHRSGAPGRRKH